MADVNTDIFTARMKKIENIDDRMLIYQKKKKIEGLWFQENMGRDYILLLLLYIIF